jgi:hypothetical protein
MRDGAADNETARLKANNFVDPLACIGVQKLVNCDAKPAGVGKKCGDIAKLNAGFWEIRDGADVILDVARGGHLGLRCLGCTGSVND